MINFKFIGFLQNGDIKVNTLSRTNFKLTKVAEGKILSLTPLDEDLLLENILLETVLLEHDNLIIEFDDICEVATYRIRNIKKWER